MSSPAQRLAELGISANKALGQHFLHDRSIVERICNAADLEPEQTVLEIGPGLGILTDGLARHAGRVIALEKDEELACALRSLVPANVDVRNQDALEFDTAELSAVPYAIVANLPYNIATAILRHFLDSAHPPGSCTFMVQREVAERMLARPPNMNILAVAMQFHGSPKIAFNVGRGAFTPPPRVTSSIVHLVVERRLDLPSDEIVALFALVRAGFSARRKTLRNALMNGGFDESTVDRILASSGIDGTLRPQVLDVDDWLALYDALQDGDR